MAPAAYAEAPDYAIPGKMTLPWACTEAYRVTWEPTGHWAQGKATGVAYDFGLPEGTAVFAPVTGIAHFRYDDRPLDTNLGHYVDVVDESGGWLVRLAHLRDPQSGDRVVRAGEQVGFSGSSGVPHEHLHLELLMRSGSNWVAPGLESLSDLYGLPISSYVEGALISPQGCAPQLTLAGMVEPVVDRVPLGEVASLSVPLRNDGRAEVTVVTVQAVLFSPAGLSRIAAAEGEWTLAPVSEARIVVSARMPAAGDWFVGRVTYRTDTRGGGMPAKGKITVARSSVAVEDLVVERPVLYVGDGLTLTARLHNAAPDPISYDRLIAEGHRPDGLPWRAVTPDRGVLTPGATVTATLRNDSVLGTPGVWRVERLGYGAGGDDYYVHIGEELFYLFGPQLVATDLRTLVSEGALHVFLTIENRGTHTSFPDAVEVWGWRTDGDTSFTVRNTTIRPIAAGQTAYVRLEVADASNQGGWRLVEAGAWQQGTYYRIPLPERAAVYLPPPAAESR